MEMTVSKDTVSNENGQPELNNQMNSASAYLPPGLSQCEPSSPNSQLFMLEQFGQQNSDPHIVQLMQSAISGDIGSTSLFEASINHISSALGPAHQTEVKEVSKNDSTTSQVSTPKTRLPTPPNPADVDGEFVIPAVMPEFYVTETLRGNKAVVYKYFLYFCEDGKKKQKYHHFRCNAPGCKARLTTNGWDEVRASSGEHHHPAPNDLPERMIRQFIKRKVLSSNEPSTTVVANALKNCPPALYATMPPQNKLIKLAQVERKRKGNKPAEPKTTKELILDDKFKFTDKGESFLVHDDGEEQEARIVCFATRTNLNQLIYCKT
ncbi:hypothetical protein DSO57_1036429 [Entomophthora muscae]|uniref:Uncharacterized protein n=1 Tax=Entomophthora muscae TaxID=34485 RepID=A0ACC2U968_9FUNG|nr:hypothetical protein DSO57_1036429 [Entomophthora muscae]